MKIKTKDKEIIEQRDVKAFLEKYGVYAEFWLVGNKAVDIEDPIERYKKEINVLKNRFGYATADCCTLDSSNSKLDEILQPFAKEHHHTDDEVRFTVEGEGIFGICPPNDSEFEVHVEKGDLLLVPAMARHWFKLTDKKNIRCIRIFKDNPKWEAVY